MDLRLQVSNFHRGFFFFFSSSLVTASLRAQERRMNYKTLTQPMYYVFISGIYSHTDCKNYFSTRLPLDSIELGRNGKNYSSQTVELQ